MKAFLKHNGAYIAIYIIALIIVGNELLTMGKIQIHEKYNVYVGNIYYDTFFKYITHFGDGIFAFIVALIISFYNVRKAVYILLSYLGAAIVSSFLKHVVYHDIYRPHFVFQYFVRKQLNEVDGVDLIGFNSFPSGHALSAFALFFCLLFLTKNHLLKIVFLLLAFVSAYSRIHLSQHWLVDIYVGSIIGFLFSVLFYSVFYKKTYLPQLNTTLPLLLSKNKNNRV